MPPLPPHLTPPPPVRRFLNRLLGTPLPVQCTVLESFFTELEACIREDKLNGTFNEGITDLQAEALTLDGPLRGFRYTPTDNGGGAGGQGARPLELRLVTLQSDRGLSFDTAVAELEQVGGHLYTCVDRDCRIISA